jgi:hypothetical protein
MDKKLFIVSESIDVEDVVMANSQKEAETIMNNRCRYDGSYVKDLINYYNFSFRAREIQRKKELPSDFKYDWPMINDDGDEYELCCEEIMDIIEEEWQKKENFRIMDEKQLKFGFYQKEKETITT